MVKTIFETGTLLTRIADHAKAIFAGHENPSCPRETWVKDGFVWATDLRIVARLPVHGRADRMPQGYEPGGKMARVVESAANKIPTKEQVTAMLTIPPLPAINKTEWCKECNADPDRPGRTAPCPVCGDSDEPIVQGNEYRPIRLKVESPAGVDGECYIALQYAEMLQWAGAELFRTAVCTNGEMRRRGRGTRRTQILVIRFEVPEMFTEGALAGIDSSVARQCLEDDFHENVTKADS